MPKPMRRRARDGPRSQRMPAWRIASISRPMSTSAGVVKVVGLGPIVLFSAPGGDAWILDVEDSLAYCLMHDHRREASPLKRETERQYALAWNLRFTLAGACFSTLTDDGKLVAYPEAPAKEIARTIAILRGAGRG